MLLTKGINGFVHRKAGRLGARRTVVETDQLKVSWRMKATISVDHRVSDGVEAAKFMQALAKYLEEPLRLLV